MNNPTNDIQWIRKELYSEIEKHIKTISDHQIYNPEKYPDYVPYPEYRSNAMEPIQEAEYALNNNFSKILFPLILYSDSCWKIANLAILASFRLSFRFNKCRLYLAQQYFREDKKDSPKIYYTLAYTERHVDAFIQALALTNEIFHFFEDYSCKWEHKAVFFQDCLKNIQENHEWQKAKETIKLKMLLWFAMMQEKERDKPEESFAKKFFLGFIKHFRFVLNQFLVNYPSSKENMEKLFHLSQYQYENLAELDFSNPLSRIKDVNLEAYKQILAYSAQGFITAVNNGEFLLNDLDKTELTNLLINNQKKNYLDIFLDILLGKSPDEEEGCTPISKEKAERPYKNGILEWDMIVNTMFENILEILLQEAEQKSQEEINYYDLKASEELSWHIKAIHDDCSEKDKNIEKFLENMDKTEYPRPSVSKRDEKNFKKSIKILESVLKIWNIQKNFNLASVESLLEKPCFQDIRNSLEEELRDPDKNKDSLWRTFCQKLKSLHKFKYHAYRDKTILCHKEIKTKREKYDNILQYCLAEDQPYILQDIDSCQKLPKKISDDKREIHIGFEKSIMKTFHAEGHVIYLPLAFGENRSFLKQPFGFMIMDDRYTIKRPEAKVRFEREGAEKYIDQNMKRMQHALESVMSIMKAAFKEREYRAIKAIQNANQTKNIENVYHAIRREALRMCGFPYEGKTSLRHNVSIKLFDPLNNVLREVKEFEKIQQQETLYETSLRSKPIPIEGILSQKYGKSKKNKKCYEKYIQNYGIHIGSGISMLPFRLDDKNGEGIDDQNRKVIANDIIINQLTEQAPQTWEAEKKWIDKVQNVLHYLIQEMHPKEKSLSKYWNLIKEKKIELLEDENNLLYSILFSLLKTSEELDTKDDQFRRRKNWKELCKILVQHTIKDDRSYIDASNINPRDLFPRLKFQSNKTFQNFLDDVIKNDLVDPARIIYHLEDIYIKRERNSEVVLPMKLNGNISGVLDIHSSFKGNMTLFSHPTHFLDEVNSILMDAFQTEYIAFVRRQSSCISTDAVKLINVFRNLRCLGHALSPSITVCCIGPWKNKEGEDIFLKILKEYIKTDRTLLKFFQETLNLNEEVTCTSDYVRPLCTFQEGEICSCGCYENKERKFRCIANKFQEQKKYKVGCQTFQCFQEIYGKYSDKIEKDLNPQQQGNDKQPYINIEEGIVCFGIFAEKQIVAVLLAKTTLGKELGHMEISLLKELSIIAEWSIEIFLTSLKLKDGEKNAENFHTVFEHRYRNFMMLMKNSCNNIDDEIKKNEDNKKIKEILECFKSEYMKLWSYFNATVSKATAKLDSKNTLSRCDTKDIYNALKENLTLSFPMNLEAWIDPNVYKIQAEKESKEIINGYIENSDKILLDILILDIIFNFIDCLEETARKENLKIQMKIIAFFDTINGKDLLRFIVLENIMFPNGILNRKYEKKTIMPERGKGLYNINQLICRLNGIDISSDYAYNYLIIQNKTQSEIETILKNVIEDLYSIQSKEEKINISALFDRTYTFDKQTSENNKDIFLSEEKKIGYLEFRFPYKKMLF